MVIILASQLVLVNEIVFFNTYSEQLTFERSAELYGWVRKYSWFSFVITPVLLMIKFSVISVVIYTGVFLSELNNDLTLGRIFGVVVGSEMVFVIASLLKFLWFVFLGGNYTLNDISFFYPLSLLNFFNPSEVDPWWIYPLQTANLFQVAYMIVLSAGLARVSGTGRGKTERIVLSTYLPAIMVWVVFVMFLTVDSRL